jgi:UDP-glucose 4-epimerase
LRILVAGNMGYVGPALVAHLREAQPGWELHGLDTALFGHCLLDGTTLPERLLDQQHFRDVREVGPDFLKRFDAVVQLAAVSNDPMGKEFEGATHAINHRATTSLAQAAAEAGVRSFVLASSCSVYGIAKGPPRTETDPVAPETAYALSKVAAERDLAQVAGGMTITALRFATACGPSPRLRLDLVLNDFVAAALWDRRITVLSDGTPWRPLIDVADMARAIEWAIGRQASEGGRMLVVNAGANSANYRVRQLAEAVADALPGTKVAINADAPVDSRSYQVDFSRFEALAPEHRPRVTLAQSIAGLIEALRASEAPRGWAAPERLIRLKVLQSHVAAGRIDHDLRWRETR